MPQEAAPAPGTTGRRLVLVTHADEAAGGRLAMLLLRRSHRVRAVVPDPDAEGVRELRDMGGELVAVDWEKTGSVEQAADGVDAACVMGLSLGEDADSAFRHGSNVVEGLKEARVPFVVYASMAGAGRGTGVPALEAQSKVERRLMSSGLTYAIVGSTFLMESLLAPPLLDGLREGQLRTPLPNDGKLQLLALADLADTCARILEDPDRHRGTRLDIASDELTINDMARVLSDVSRREVRAFPVSADDVAGGNEDAQKMYEWLAREGHRVDMPRLHREHADVSWLTFRQWATMQDWAPLGPEAAARGRQAT